MSTTVLTGKDWDRWLVLVINGLPVVLRGVLHVMSVMFVGTFRGRGLGIPL